MGSRSARAMEQILAERRVRHARRHYAASCGQNGWTDRDAVWFLDSGGPNEAAAMRPYVKLLRPLVTDIVSQRLAVVASWCNLTAQYLGTSARSQAPTIRGGDGGEGASLPQSKTCTGVASTDLRLREKFAPQFVTLAMMAKIVLKLQTAFVFI